MGLQWESSTIAMGRGMRSWDLQQRAAMGDGEVRLWYRRCRGGRWMGHGAWLWLAARRGEWQEVAVMAGRRERRKRRGKERD